MRAFVIAMACEADAVRPFLGADDRLYVSGVGKANAAAAAMKAICRGADEIVNCGICGGFGDAVELGGVYTVDRAVEYDFDLAEVNRTAKGVKDGRTSPYIPAAPAPGLEAKVLATGDRFTDDDDDVELLASLGCELRDMEGAAIADICDQNHVPLTMIKAVSDVHGCGSMIGQYRLERAFALARLAAAVYEFISGGEDTPMIE